MKTNDKFGKFASVEELLKGYLALEAEFTKKCQRLKEAEAALASLTQNLDAELKNVAEAAEQAAVENYLRSVCGVSSPRIISSSAASALTPVKKPRSLKEARELAERFLSGGA